MVESSNKSPKAQQIPLDQVFEEPPENPALFERIISKLKEKDIKFSQLSHKPCLTSQESADVRGVTLESGAKVEFLFQQLSLKFPLLGNATSRQKKQPKRILFMRDVSGQKNKLEQNKKSKEIKEIRLCNQIISICKSQISSQYLYQSIYYIYNPLKVHITYEITSCLSGAIPPFGSFWNIQTYLDNSLLQEKQVNFNCGLRTESVSMNLEEFLKVQEFEKCEFTDD